MEVIFNKSTMRRVIVHVLPDRYILKIGISEESLYGYNRDKELRVQTERFRVELKRFRTSLSHLNPVQCTMLKLC